MLKFHGAIQELWIIVGYSPCRRANQRRGTIVTQTGRSAINTRPVLFLPEYGARPALGYVFLNVQLRKHLEEFRTNLHCCAICLLEDEQKARREIASQIAIGCFDRGLLAHEGEVIPQPVAVVAASGRLPVRRRLGRRLDIVLGWETAAVAAVAAVLEFSVALLLGREMRKGRGWAEVVILVVVLTAVVFDAEVFPELFANSLQIQTVST